MSSTMPRIPHVGALDRWRDELRNGSRQRSTADALWAAACWEARAREHQDADAARVAVSILAADEVRAMLEAWLHHDATEVEAYSIASIEALLARTSGVTSALNLSYTKRLLDAYRQERSEAAA